MGGMSDKQEIKFYIENNNYYLYEVHIVEDSKTKHNINIESIGNMLTKYLNINYNFWNELIECSLADNSLDIDSMINNFFIELQNRLNYILAVLIINKFLDYLHNSFMPNFSTRLIKVFEQKINNISSIINSEEIMKNFDFQYIKDIDMNIGVVADNNTRFKTIVKIIMDNQKIDRFIARNLLNNSYNENINILALTNSNSITNIKYEILPNVKTNRKMPIMEAYIIDDLETFLYFEMLQIQKYDIKIKCCELCEKYFIPEKDSKQIYCDNIFENNKTCRELAFTKNKEDDTVYNLYRKTYKTQHKRKSTSYMKKTEERWEMYSEDLKLEYNKCKNNEITLEEFQEWIQKNNDCTRYERDE